MQPRAATRSSLQCQSEGPAARSTAHASLRMLLRVYLLTYTGYIFNTIYTVVVRRKAPDAVYYYNCMLAIVKVILSFCEQECYFQCVYVCKCALQFTV